MAGAATPATAQDLVAGRARAQQCVACHGPLGIATVPETPHLAAMPAPYLAAQLRAFRSGARKHEVMAVVAKALSDEDIALLAAWFSSIKIEATAP